MFGPRVTYRSYGSLTPSPTYFSAGSISEAMSVEPQTPSRWRWEAGLIYKLTEHLAWRVIQVDYLYTHFGGTRQNNARIESGVVYRWGGR